MLLRKYRNHPQILITIGQLSLVFGILINRFLPRLWASDFGNGFSAGMSGALIGISLVANLYALMKYRELKNNES